MAREDILMVRTCEYIWSCVSLIRLLISILEYGDYSGGTNYHKSLKGERGGVKWVKPGGKRQQ